MEAQTQEATPDTELDAGAVIHGIKTGEAFTVIRTHGAFVLARSSDGEFIGFIATHERERDRQVHTIILSLAK